MNRTSRNSPFFFTHFLESAFLEERESWLCLLHLVFSVASVEAGTLA